MTAINLVLFGAKPVELAIFTFFHNLLEFRICGTNAFYHFSVVHDVNKLNTYTKNN